MANTATVAQLDRLIALLDRAEDDGKNMSGTREQVQRCRSENELTVDLVAAMIEIVEELAPQYFA
jgi:hypothetical protein